ncbi:uncharacterized protein LOC124808903 isoform X1 [Hydra vulgaris]|uniref:uncharacterized protein LOC124808903 isoform X1 n=1 Tax=Hydra vulgaris TaxID=6087 RepID=UPI0032EA11C3
MRAQNDLHSSHVDGPFCTVTIKNVEEVCSFLGPKDVCFISQDDKAQIPIGITAANKQAPILMHMEYRVSLPDHDWVIAAKHKLIPSVYAGIAIKPDGLGKSDAVSHSGPTYVAIRSGKHSSSTAYAHGLDFERLLTLPEFDSITKDPLTKLVKPVVVFSVDGRSDENPRYAKVIEIAIHHFLTNDLDALLIMTNAPGRSAFNRAEKRMAPLSKELAGLILPHDHYGTHLDSKGRTVDLLLDKQNFKFAGNSCASVFSGLMIDQFPTVAEYIDPDNKTELDVHHLLSKDQDWFASHVRTSQYFKQIVKCEDPACCALKRSSYLHVIPGRFLPPPIPISQSENGLKAVAISDVASKNRFSSVFFLIASNIQSTIPRSLISFKLPPYDLFCPSVQSSLSQRICKHCNLYFASQVMLKKHVSVTHSNVINQMAITFSQIRPVCIAAKRKRELMAVIAIKENAAFA